MHRPGRNAQRSLLCMLLALLALTGGSSLRASFDIAADTRDVPAAVESAQITSAQFDGRLPFLAGGSGLFAAPVELPTRSGESVRARTLEATREHALHVVHPAIVTALRLREASRKHAAVARRLADAHAGREDAHSTPPPSPVS